MRLFHRSPSGFLCLPGPACVAQRRTLPLALGMAVSGWMQAPAQAAEAPADAEAQTLDAVQVRTSFQSQNTRAIATKQAAPTVVDSVAADSIGQLADFNVGDALRRVTGVSTVEYQGEPRYVTVRGLNGNYNSMLIDGFAFASNDIGSRQAMMDVLPANFVDRIDVVKSFLPENDGGVIGGVTNLVTATGFGRPDGLLTFSAKGGANLMGSRYGGRSPVGEGDLKWGKRFGRDGQFAFLGAASQWRREISVPQQENGGGLNWYAANGTRDPVAYGGTGAAVPSERRWYNYANTRQRRGLTARVDWQPEGPLSGQCVRLHLSPARGLGPLYPERPGAEQRAPDPHRRAGRHARQPESVRRTGAVALEARAVGHQRRTAGRVAGAMARRAARKCLARHGGQPTDLGPLPAKSPGVRVRLERHPARIHAAGPGPGRRPGALSQRLSPAGAHRLRRTGRRPAAGAASQHGRGQPRAGAGRGRAAGAHAHAHHCAAHHLEWPA